MKVHGSRQWYWGLRAISIIEQPVRSIPKSSSLIKCCPKWPLCTLEARPPSPPKLLLCRVCIKLFKNLRNKVFYRWKSMVRGSDSEACGPYHWLSTQFVQSPSQAALSNVVRNDNCVHLKANLRPRRSSNCVGFVLNCSKIEEIKSFNDGSPWFAAVILRPAVHIIHWTPSSFDHQVKQPYQMLP